MTIENIKHNDPLAVYKKANEAEMFLGISFNNLVVSAYTFLLGAFMSIGTFLALLRNGIMLGVFQYFFIERGLFQESFLTIWQHGTIEISCIIIAGAAGLTMGKGIVFPGTYTRVNSFKISALRGLKIFTGIAPLIILAAFIESFLTRHTGINNGVRLAVIILSLFFILFYFVWYPWCLSKTRSQNHVQSEKISYKEPTGYDFSRVLSAEQILGNTFKFFNQNILSFIMVVFGLATIHSIISYGFSSLQDNSGLLNVHSIRSFFQLSSIRAHFWFGVITLSILQMHLCLKISKLLNDKHAANSSFLYLVLASFTASFIVLLPFSIGLFWGIVSFIIIGPVLFLAVYKSYHERIFVIAALPGTFLLISNSWGNQFWNSLKIFIFVTVLFVLLNTQVVWEYIQGVFINFKSDDSLTNTLEIIVLTFLTISLMAVYLYFLVTTSIFNYYSFKEIALAESLNDRIDAFGQRNSLFGFEKETKR